MTLITDSEHDFTFPNYTNIKLIAQGTFANVYLACQNSTGQKVAIKHLHQRFTPPKDKRDKAKRYEQRFLQEAKICTQLNNPYIVQLIDQGFCSNKSPYAVFEYVPGKTLADYLAEQGSLNGEQTKQLMLQVLDALACAHQQGIIHRDLKPQNIMVTKTGTEVCAKVLDFGISTWQETSKQNNKLTLTQETLGTPRYSSPEQLRHEIVGSYSDLYAWGLIMIECLTGKTVVNANTVAECIRQQLDPSPLPFPPLITQHPVAHLLRRAITKNVKQRLTSANQAHAELSAISMHNLVQKPCAAVLSPSTQDTQIYSEAYTASTEKRFMTMLACRLKWRSKKKEDYHDEHIDELLNAHIQQCYELLSHYGGQSSAYMGNTFLAFFSDDLQWGSSVERAAKTALLIKEKISQWSRNNVEIHFTVEQAINCGMISTNVAFNSANQLSKRTLDLLDTAENNSIIASHSIYAKLNKHMHFDQYCNTQNEAYYLLTSDQPTQKTTEEKCNIEGRDKELEKLLQIHSKSKKSKQAVIVHGEAGIGKTALIDQASVIFSRKKDKIVRLQASFSNQQSALYPILKFIINTFLESRKTSYKTIENLLKNHGINSRHHSIVLSHWLGVSSQVILKEIHLYSPEKQQSILFECLYKLIFNTKKEENHVIIIEDIHWLDTLSYEFIQYINSNISNQAFLLILSSRTQGNFESGPGLSIGNIETYSIPLMPLNQDATEAIVKQSLTVTKDNPKQLDEIVKRSSGIPLFIKELIQLANTGLYSKKEIPLSLDAILASRIEQADDAKALLYFLSVFEQSITINQLLTLAPIEKHKIKSSLEKLKALNLIKTTSPSPDSHSEQYCFGHSLLQEAAYQKIDIQDRTRYHLLIAGYLSKEKITAQSIVIAHHYAAARDYSSAVEHGLNGVEYLLSIASSEQALITIQKIQSWCTSLNKVDSHRAQLRAQQFKLHAMTNQSGWAHSDVSESVSQLQRMIPKHISPFSQNMYSVCYWALATHYHVASVRHEAKKMAQQLVDTSKHLIDPELMLLGYGLQGVTSWIDGNYLEADQALNKALKNRTQSDQSLTKQYGLDAHTWAKATHANVYWFKGETERALIQAEKTVNQAKKINHPPSLGVALMYQAFIYQHEQDHQQTQQCASELLCLANTYGLPAVQGYAAALLGWSTGDASMIEKTLQQLQSLGCLLGSSYIYSLLAEATEEKSLHTALGWVNEGLQAAKDIKEEYFLAPLYQQKAYYLNRLCEKAYHPTIEQCLQQAKSLCSTQAIRLDCYRPLKEDINLFTWYKNILTPEISETPKTSNIKQATKTQPLLNEDYS